MEPLLDSGVLSEESLMCVDGDGQIPLETAKAANNTDAYMWLLSRPSVITALSSVTTQICGE